MRGRAKLLPIIIACMAMLPACKGSAAPAAVGPSPELEINLASYHNPPKGDDKIGEVYNLPSDETLLYFSGKGFRTLKLPMNWNRLQPKANGPLDEEKMAELDDFIDRARHFGFRIIVNLTAFGGRDGYQLGSKELPTETLADFWTKFTTRYVGKLDGYDIMNEPHDMPDDKAWPRAAQQAVDAIRKIDKTTTLYVEGDDWSNAGRWMQSNANLDIKDPSNRLIYSAHIYFDRDTSGHYKVPLEQDGVTPEIASERLTPFVNWLRLKKFKGHIGEFGVPSADPGWLPILQNFLDKASGYGDVLVGITYWAGGDWTSSWNLSVQPRPNTKWADRPQMKLLNDYQARHNPGR